MTVVAIWRKLHCYLYYTKIYKPHESISYWFTCTLQASHWCESSVCIAISPSVWVGMATPREISKAGKTCCKEKSKRNCSSAPLQSSDWDAFCWPMEPIASDNPMAEARIWDSLSPGEATSRAHAYYLWAGRHLQVKRSWGGQQCGWKWQWGWGIGQNGSCYCINLLLMFKGSRGQLHVQGRWKVFLPGTYMYKGLLILLMLVVNALWDENWAMCNLNQPTYPASFQPTLHLVMPGFKAWQRINIAERM